MSEWVNKWTVLDRVCLDPIALYDQHPRIVQIFWKISPCPTLISISKPLLLILCLLPNIELNNALWIIPDIQLLKAVDKHKWPYSEVFLLNPRKLPRVLWPTNRSSSSVTKLDLLYMGSNRTHVWQWEGFSFEEQCSWLCRRSERYEQVPNALGFNLYNWPLNNVGLTAQVHYMQIFFEISNLLKKLSNELKNLKISKKNVVNAQNTYR